MQVNEGPKQGAKGAASAHDVPGKVVDGFDLTLPWQPPEETGTGDGDRAPPRGRRESVRASLVQHLADRTEVATSAVPRVVDVLDS
ncbi:hypothetical protein [Streptomyces sp. Isolate_45]|uniref:hypothetical protein n=1 Tax=Streptomyces sp. Isolate_45 TaxID=2950111 RepID=UPI002481F616|nr:hypothetical protein [Streptomyces sp. Isolate_45]MDA5279176.1 hypothetical protein [Streptomyces sp. Isolate_45]